jgi:hypothetical protein
MAEEEVADGAAPEPQQHEEEAAAPAEASPAAAEPAAAAGSPPPEPQQQPEEQEAAHASETTAPAPEATPAPEAEPASEAAPDGAPASEAAAPEEAAAPPPAAKSASVTRREKRKAAAAEKKAAAAAPASAAKKAAPPASPRDAPRASPPAPGPGRLPKRFSGLSAHVAGRLEAMFAAGTLAPEQLDERIVSSLRGLPPPDAADAVAQLEGAARAGPIRNASAYLAGVIRRVASLPPGAGAAAAPGPFVGGPPFGGRGPPPAAFGGGPGGGFGAPGGEPPLAPQAAAVLDHLNASGAVRPGDLDARSLRALAGRPPEVQALVLSSFADRNLRGIRNMAAFFTSHLAAVEGDLREGRVVPPPLGAPGRGYGGPPGGGYGGGGPPQGGGFGGPPGGGYGGYGGPPPEQQHYGGPPPGAYGAPPQYGGPPPGQQQQPHYGAPPPQHYGGPPPQTQPPQQQAYGAPGPYGAPPPQAYGAPPPGPAPTPAPALVDYSADHAAWGIRTAEMHALSPLARCVPPPAAARLQQLWDAEGCKLVSLMGERAWGALAALEGGAGAGAVDEAAAALRAAPDSFEAANAAVLAAVARRAPAPAPQAHAPPQQQQYGAPPPGQYGAPAPQYGAAPPPAFGAPQPQQQHYGAPPPGPAGGADLAALPPAVQAAVARAVGAWGGLLKPEHFDGRAVAALLRVGEGAALRAVEDFGRHSPAQMRSVSGYLIGCVRKYEEGGGGGGGAGGPVRSGPRGGGGGPPGGPGGGWEPQRYPY